MRALARSGIVGLGVSGWERAGRVPSSAGPGRTALGGRRRWLRDPQRRWRHRGPRGGHERRSLPGGRACARRRVGRELARARRPRGSGATSATCDVPCGALRARTPPGDSPAGPVGSRGRPWGANGRPRRAPSARWLPAAVCRAVSREPAGQRQREGEPPESAVDAGRAGRRRQAPTSRSDPGPGPLPPGAGS